MAGIPAWVYAQLGQNVTVEPYADVTAGLEVFGTATTVRAVVEESDALARTAEPASDQRTMAVLRCPLATDCPSGSRVTLASGRVGIVTEVKRWDGGTSEAPSHLEVTLSGAVPPS